MIRVDGLPTPRCRCAQCRGGRMRLWRNLTPARRHALLSLDERSPRTMADLWDRSRVRAATLLALCPDFYGKPTLARRLALSAGHRDSPRIEFFTLSELGAEVLAEVRTHQRKRA